MANLPYHALKTNVFLKAFHYGKGSFTTETYLTKAEIRWILLRACTRLLTCARQPHLNCKGLFPEEKDQEASLRVGQFRLSWISRAVYFGRDKLTVQDRGKDQ